MLAVNELIRRKRDGQAISGPEMEELIGAYAYGEVPDYQMAAWLMAVYFQGLSRGETVMTNDAEFRRYGRWRMSRDQGR